MLYAAYSLLKPDAVRVPPDRNGWLVDGTYWRLLALMLPVVLPGTLLGVSLYKSLSDVDFRRITLMLLGTSGLGLLVKAAGVITIFAATVGSAAAH